jgi:hypothetical protein
MGWLAQLKGLHDELVQLVLEPERVAAWVQHLQGCGMHAELAWRPSNLVEAQQSGRCCIGRIQLRKAPIDYVELIVCGPPPEEPSTGRVTREYRHEDRFYIRTAQAGPGGNLRASRKPERRFWVGPRTGTYHWRGGPLAQELAEDQALNRILSQESAGRIEVKPDRQAGGVYISRTYVGTRTLAEPGQGTVGDITPGGAFGRLLERVGLWGEIIRDYQLPSRALLEALGRIGNHVRRHVGRAAGTTTCGRPA